MESDPYSGLYWQRNATRRAEAKTRRAEAKKRKRKGQRQARAIRLECQEWLEHVGTLGCSFRECVLRERKQGCPFMWDGRCNRTSTIITDGHGQAKTPFTITQNRPNQLAVMPVDVDDLVFRSWVLPSGGGRKSPRCVCLIYRVMNIGEEEMVLRIENVGIGVGEKNWWKMAIAPELLKAAYVALARAEYKPSKPFALN